MPWPPEPLTPTVAVGRGPVARALVERLLRGPRGELRGVWAPGWVAVEGDDLPWVEGVVYLGVWAQAPALRVPTTAVFHVPPDLLQRRVLAACEPGDAPVALLDDVVLPLGPARPLGEAELRDALAGMVR